MNMQRYHPQQPTQYNNRIGDSKMVRLTTATVLHVHLTSTLRQLGLDYFSRRGFFFSCFIAEMQVGLSQRLSHRLRTSNDSELNGAIEDALTMIADMAAEASTLPAEAGPQSIEEFRQSLIYDDV